VSCGDGASTCTGWNCRSSAASFSTCLRYSSGVLAPITLSSPRASIGLSMLLTSMPPSPLPVPTIMCSSSISSKNSPLDTASRASADFSRSSNSPRILAPASIEARSSDTTRLPCRPVGTAPSAILSASPSTIAVFPTPDLPISTGLFLVLRPRIWISRASSCSRPITGSSCPRRAASERSRPYRQLSGPLILLSVDRV